MLLAIEPALDKLFTFQAPPSGAAIALILASASPTVLMAETMRAPAVAPTAPKTSSPDASNPGEDEAEVSEVVVTARKPAPQPGAVVGDIKPEVQLGPAEIQSYGVSTVTELLEELSPQTRSDRGRGGESPVILLNGRRISSFNEIQNIPSEAILRVDILPEEVALKYGYTADQRVVNFVLRRRFRAITGELQGGAATEGGQESGQAEVDLLHIRGDNRLNLDLKYSGSSDVTDAARGLQEPSPAIPFALAGNVVGVTPGGEIDPALSALAGTSATIAAIPASLGGRVPTLADFAATAGQANVTDVGADRTLSPATQSVSANAVLARPVVGGMNATFNASLGATRSQSLQGLPGLSLSVPAGDPFSPFGDDVAVDRYVDAFGPLRQATNGWTAHLGSTLNRDLADWRLSLTTALDHADSQTDTDMGVNPAHLQAVLDSRSPSLDPFAPLPRDLLAELPQATARSISNSANLQVLVNGPVWKLPAGQLYVSAKAGDTQSALSSASLRMGDFQSANLARNDANARLSLDLPLASREHKVFAWLGDLSINFNGTLDRLSDYGVLKAFGYGVNWTPIPGYNLIISHTNDQAAPTIQQLGAPTIETPGVRVFDYAIGQTVDITQISGGDRALVADNRNVFKIGLTLKPIVGQDFTLTANFIQSRIDHAIQTFPAADAAIEAAFPDRFIRDVAGVLVEEDDRPVEVAKSDRGELRWGLNYSSPFGPQPPPRPDRRPRSADGSTQDSRRGAEGGGERGQGRNGGGGGDSSGGGRGGFGRGGPATGGRLQFALYHTVYFTDRTLVRPGGPVLDLLDGAAASSTGGQYRNEVEAQAGMTFAGFGARLSADWRSASFVHGGVGSSTGDISFSDVATVNLRLFDNLGQQPNMTRRYPWLRGARITLAVTNLFDQRISVHGAAGATPPSYQAGYLDPIGRTVRLSLRKLFF